MGPGYSGLTYFYYICDMNRSERAHILASATRVVQQSLTAEVVAQAVAANEWLSADDVAFAAQAICDQYLAPDKVAEWLANYPLLPTTEPKVVGVVAAGNIPLAAFFDILCVVASGHRCKVKYSSKDRVLMPTICKALSTELGWPIEPMEMGDRVDALIASGSDTAMESVGRLYGSVPTLLRSHRSSVALLGGGESDEQLALLAEDAFRYNSLGCRNVTLILAPRTISTERIVKAVAGGRRLVAQGYLNNYRQAVATAMLTGQQLIGGGHFVAEQKWEFPVRLAQVNIAHYDTTAEANEWIAANDSHIQCVVGAQDIVSHPRRAPFGQAQRPTLVDWPDGVDVMQWLSKL